MTWLTNPFRFGGPPLLIGARRYWRLVGLPVRDAWIYVANMEMAATPGGANLCSGGTPLSSLPTTMSNAFDGNVASVWNGVYGSGWTVTNWIGYDFGVDVAIREVRLQASNGGSSYYANAQAFIIQASYDAVTWDTVAMIGDGTDWTMSEWRSYAIPDVYLAATRAEARAWRINPSANNGHAGEYSVGEIIFASTPGGAQIATGGCAFHGRIFGSGPATTEIARNSFDGSLTTGHRNNSGPRFLGYLWPSAPSIAEVRLAPYTGRLTMMITAGTVEWSVDLINWNVAATFSGLPVVSGAYQAVAVP